MVKKVSKKKLGIKPIDGVFKTNGNRTDIESSLVSEADMKAQVKKADIINWVLSNALSSTSGAEAVMVETILNNFRKWGYHGSQIDTVVRCLKKFKFSQEQLIESFKPCYKDSTLQPITVGNLQYVFEELIGMIIGVTVEGEYCSTPVEVAYIPKTLVPVIKSMPVANQIQWLGDSLGEAIADGNKYMDEHGIKRDGDVEIVVKPKKQKKNV